MGRWSCLAFALATLLSLVACATPTERLGLRVEDRAAEGVVRIHNLSSVEAVLYHTAEHGFGRLPQMIWLRFRDRSGELVRFGGTLDDGWWSPLFYSSNLYGPDDRLPRRELRIEAGGFHDVRLDVADMAASNLDSGLIVHGPCEVQKKVVLYPNRRTWRPVELVTGWQPADCPQGR